MLARRVSTLRPPTAEERQAHQALVDEDRSYVRKKFYPERNRTVRHAGFTWKNPMPPGAVVQDASTNDTGLPAASISPTAVAVEKWCKYGSWALCGSCATVIPQRLKEKQIGTTRKVLKCHNCKKPEASRTWVSKAEDVPELLRGLSTEEIQALRPLDVDCGPTWKADFGYYFHSSMIRFSWCKDDVEDKIKALDRRSRRRAKQARTPEALTVRHT